MKKLFTFLFALVATTALWAEDFEVDGIYYNILSDKTNEVEVTYGSSDYSGFVTIPSAVTYNGTTYSVTSIGNQAFWYCTGLTSVTIGNSVTSIGNDAFYNCSGLTSVTIGNSVMSIGDKAFADCKGLTSVTIGNSVTSIGEYAFAGCSSFTSIVVEEGNTIYDSREHCNAIIKTATNTLMAGCQNTIIPNSVMSIGDKAFAYCSSLTSITIPNSVTSIGNDAFWYCTGLTSVTIGNSVTSIGEGAFADCKGLTSVTIPNSVTSIGNDAFYYCSSLTSITIPNSVMSIGDKAFAYCSSLTSITIPNSVTSIGNDAFRYCTGLTSVTIGNSVTSIGEEAFYGCSGLPVENSLRYADTYLVEAVDKTLSTYSIKEGTKWIGSYAFYNCSGLTSVTIGNSVTTIGEYAFAGCSSLTSIVVEEGNTIYDSREHCNAIIETNSNTLILGCQNTIIPNSVTSIGGGAFYNCSHLTSITIPNSVMSIGDKAFYNCSGLTSITSLAEVPPTLGNSAFNNVSTRIPVYVACGSVSAYRSAEGWKDFTNIQEPLVEYSIAVGVNDSIMGTSQVDYNKCEGAQITATAKLGYHFVQWSDGNTDNPRTLELTQDTILTAEFAVSYSGQCGDNLYWAYDEASKKISITGSGDMFDYTKSTQPWLLFQEQITEVTTSNTTTSIGTSAFEGCVRLGKVSLGYGMENIAANAFAECKRLYDIYVFASYPPFAEESSFANYNVYLYVPCENQRDYILDVVWGDFKYIECIGAESDDTGGDDVTVTPGTNDVTITWPTEDDADTYSIVITKDGEVFCTLTFNADGQLLNIAFAPGRQGNHPAQYAEATTNGYRFTVTGLDEGTKYAYNLDVKDDSSKTIKSYEGEFTTESTTALDNINSQSANCQKILRDGQLVIIRDGKTYNAQGAAL